MPMSGLVPAGTALETRFCLEDCVHPSADPPHPSGDPSPGHTADRLSRRSFVTAGALGGIALTSGLACAPPGPEQRPAGQPAEGAPTTSDPGSFSLSEVAIAELARGMDEGRWTSVDITQRYLERITEVDVGGPGLRSVIETNPDALEIAARMDEERRAATPRGPLHGIPILVKDNIGTADRMDTTAGSWALAGAPPARDAYVAERLRRAGAIILGKANLSEWANFRSSRSSSGWSGRGGQCRNPYVLDRNPCGSSSGSGVAVSASLCAAAIGTETNGSIVCPASANGVVGLKPTVGLVSRTGIIPIAHSQDTAGPMARSVTDAALVLGALVGQDASDPATRDGADHMQVDYTEFLVANGLEGATIGVARDYFDFHSGVDALMEDALSAMSAAGATIVDPVTLEGRHTMGEQSYQVLLYEFKADLETYLATRGPGVPVRTLEQLIAWNEANRDRELVYFGQEIFEEAAQKGPLTDRLYREALAEARELAGAAGIDRVMEAHGLDAIVAPTGGPAWTTDLVNGDHFTGSSSSPAAIAGYPNITVPAGNIHGLPVGISFFGRAWSEGTLLRLAYAYEQISGHRLTPEFRPTLP